MSIDDQRTRTYSSPLRESQANRTRDLILDALTNLLGEHRADEVSTRQIAERAGVSQPTVYRHFPNRLALVDGLSDRVDQQFDDPRSARSPKTIEEWAAVVEAYFQGADNHRVEATADAVLNADPRRFSEASRRRSREIAQAVARSLPDLDERNQLRFAALTRTLISVQTWLRMREEFGLGGSESGPLVGWAIQTLLQEARAGYLPGTLSAAEPPSRNSGEAAKKGASERPGG